MRAVFHLRIFDRVHERTDIAVEASRSFDDGWWRRARWRSVEASAQTVLHPLGQPASPAHAACPRPKLRVADIEGHFPIWWRVSAERLVFGSAARQRHLGSHSSAICMACTLGSGGWARLTGPARHRRSLLRWPHHHAMRMHQSLSAAPSSSALHSQRRQHGKTHKIACNLRQLCKYVGRILPPFLAGDVNWVFPSMSNPKMRVSRVIRPTISATRHAMDDTDPAGRRRVG